MDYDKLNNIINNFIERRNVYVDNLNLVIPLCKNVLEKKELPTTTDTYSTHYSIDESINLISNFLSTIDINLEDQFINIVKGVDSDNNPITIFDNNMRSDESYSDKDKVYIGIDNTLDDTFLLLHEVLHYMNSYQIIGIDDKNKEFDLGENYTRSFYGEAVSITAEKLFGEYLVQNNYINENDFNIRQNKRLKSTREDAEAVIVEAGYIEMINNNIKIDENSIKEYSKKYMDDSVISKVINKEINTNKNTYDILRHNSLQFPTRQRYVIADSVSDSFHYTNKDIERFKYINHEVGNINADLYNTTKNIQSR